MSLNLVTGQQDEGSRSVNLVKDLTALERKVGSVQTVLFATAAFANEGTSTLTAEMNYFTAGGTVGAHTFNLPATAEDGQEHIVMTSQITTAATFAVAAPGTATIVGAPSATAVHAPIKFKYVASENKWYRWH